MRKLALALAALGALSVAMPALADTVVIHKHRDHMRPPVMFHHHHHHDNKTVIIKHHDD